MSFFPDAFPVAPADGLRYAVDMDDSPSTNGAVGERVGGPTKVVFAASERAPAVLVEAARNFARQRGIPLDERPAAPLAAEAAPSLPPDSRMVAICTTAEAPAMLNAARRAGAAIGLIPCEPNSPLLRWFALPAKQEAQIESAFLAEPHPVDILTCNDEVVIGQLVMGDTPFLEGHRHGARPEPRSWRTRWKTLFHNLGRLKGIAPFSVTLTTAKDRVIRTVITGLVTIENEVRGPATRLLTTSVSAQDGKMSTVLVAPKSLLEYFGFLFTAVFKGDHTLKRLPRAISYLKTSYLKIEGPGPLSYRIDGRPRESGMLELHLHSRALMMAVGEPFLALQAGAGTEDEKDTARIENLPEQKDRVAMLKRHLPLFTRALEEDFKDLFRSLRESASIRADYIIMTILSAIIASLGLFLNSAAVIIGAMVLAPLMSPIVSLAMGLLRGDQSLIRKPLATLGSGVAIALGTAAAMALLVPTARITEEIAARVQPSLLDLGVAIASGIAAAYAFARENIGMSLPGVAIAVALMPPLCAAGIGIGWMDLPTISGAMLLFVTNLIGIALSSAVTFWALGYAPVIKSRRGFTVSLALLFAVSIPLSISFRNMHQTWRMEQGIARQTYELGAGPVRLSEVRVRLYRGSVHLRAESVGGRSLNLDDLAEIRDLIEQRWGLPVILDIDSRLTL